LKLVISATAQRTAVAANARHLASLLARQAAVSQTRSAKARIRRQASKPQKQSAAVLQHMAAFLSV
jgi:hypothetical protein